MRIEDLGRMGYAEAYALQTARHAEVLASRVSGGEASIGTLLLVEHDPVITVTARPGAAEHVVAPPELLRRHGIEIAQTDRGGDVTYHGPGQLVVYPIVDLNALNCRIVDYLRLLEDLVIRVLADLGIEGRRDPGATGVWAMDEGNLAKVCAMGVRVRRWVTMHGLALNVDPDLTHFQLIVPCGLHGRPVSSLRRLLGERCPGMDEVKEMLGRRATEMFAARAALAAARRGDHSSMSEPGGSQR